MVPAASTTVLVVLEFSALLGIHIVQKCPLNQKCGRGYSDAGQRDSVINLCLWPTDEPLEIRVYTSSIDTETVADATMISEALFFGPTGTLFLEPGIQMSFQISLDLVDPPDGFRIAAFKIVDGIPTTHPFPPVVNRTSGQVLVKTLSFSAYVLMQIPVPIEETPKQSLPVIQIDPPGPTTNEFASSDSAKDRADNGFGNPRSPVFLGVVGLSILVLLGASFFAYTTYVKLYQATKSKAGMKLDENSYRMQEENEPMAGDTLVLGTELISADGTEVSPPSPRIGGGDMQRIFSNGDDMSEAEPPAPSRLSLLSGFAAMNLQNMLGSVGLIGSGARVTLDATARPMPCEVQSTVLKNKEGENHIEMTADLVLVDMMDAVEEDMEEDEPIMEEAEALPSWCNDLKYDPYYGQEFLIVSSSGQESDSTPSVETPQASTSPVISGTNLGMPCEGEDQDEAEPRAQQLMAKQEEIEPGLEEIEPEQVEILHDKQADKCR